MRFNMDILQEKFKDIQRQCYKDNILLPQALEHAVPKEYVLPSSELGQPKDEIIEHAKERRKEEIQILRGEHSKYDTPQELELEELKQFINKYPQFKDILDGDI